MEKRIDTYDETPTTRHRKSRTSSGKYAPHACSLAVLLSAGIMAGLILFHLLDNHETDMSITTFLIIYAVGVLINAFVAASIWDDLMEERQLEKVRLAVLLFFVLASLATWLYAFVYLLVSFMKRLFKRKSEEEDES